MSTTISCPIPGASQPKEPVRLIDVNSILRSIDVNGSAYDGIEYQAYKAGAEYVRSLIEDAPTIDPESLRPTAHWISVKDRPPEPETEVFIYAEIRRDNKVIGYVTTTAIYEDGTIHTGESIWNWDDINYWGTYDEETDDYIIPEGWWEERHYNDDDTRNLQVDDFVTHWMPLPKPPKETHND